MANMINNKELAKTLSQAKGDLFFTNSSGVMVRLPVGNDGQFLITDSTSDIGVRWTNIKAYFSGGFISGIWTTTK